MRRRPAHLASCWCHARRARLAVTLTRELEINAPGVALALDLMDVIEALKASLRRR
ncbi:MAG: hypothetical protein H7340_03175 [Variovorax sp.]|nr:hypothetical protein [Variovorax sp.]